MHPECVAATESAARLCALLGHEVEEARPDYDGEAFVEHFLVLWAHIAHAIAEQVKRATGALPPRHALEGWTWGLRDHYLAQTGGALERAVAHMQQVTEQMRAFHERFDVVLAPDAAPDAEMAEAPAEPAAEEPVAAAVVLDA